MSDETDGRPAGDTRVRRSLRDRYSLASLRLRLSGPGCLALFLAGLLLGAVSGLMLYRHRLAAPPHQAAPTPTPPPQASLPLVMAPLLAPRMVFGPTKTEPKETPEVLDAGLAQVYCFFDVPEAPPKAPVVPRWVLGGQAPTDAKADVARQPGDHLRGYAVLRPPAGGKAFAEGIYEVELLVNGERALEGSFAMLTGGPALLQTPKGMERYRPEVTNLTVSAGPPPTPPKKPFVLPATPAKVFVRFKYAYALPGTALTVYWLCEDGLVAQATTEINIQKDSGTAEAWFGPKPPAKLPTGKYGVMVGLSEGTPPLAKEDFWIGRRPTPQELLPAGSAPSSSAAAGGGKVDGR